MTGSTRRRTGFCVAEGFLVLAFVAPAVDRSAGAERGALDGAMVFETGEVKHSVASVLTNAEKLSQVATRVVEESATEELVG